MSKIIVIGWSTKLLVRDSHFTQFVELLSNAQSVEGSDTLQTLKPVEFEVRAPHPDLGREISQRERELENAASDNNTKWYAEFNKANSLAKELAAAKAQIDLLVEKEVTEAFCPQDTVASATVNTSDAEIF